jgi:hypothetical protein
MSGSDGAGSRVGHQQGHAVGGLNCQNERRILADDDVRLRQVARVVCSVGPFDDDGAAVDLPKAHEARGRRFQRVRDGRPGRSLV